MRLAILTHNTQHFCISSPDLQVADLQSNLTLTCGTVGDHEHTIHSLTAAKAELEQQLEAQTSARKVAEELNERIHAQR
jgi:hypothetical protein